MSYRLSRAADTDLDHIWSHIAAHSPKNADAVEQRLHEAMELLARFPGAGHSRKDVKNPAYRFWNVYDFVIAYRTRGRSVIVVRVLHGRRDFRRLFRK
jgi:toxin ParE1/3/4